MSRMRKRRGISLGTVFMLVVTVCVSCAMGYILPQLQGSQPFVVDAGRMLEALSLTDLPELALSDIPISFTADTEAESTTQSTGTPGSLFAAATETPVPETQVTVTASPPPVPTVAATETPAAARSFTVAFTGSVMMEDSIRKGAWIDEADKYDFSKMLGYIAPELKAADLCVTPLENIIADRDEYSDNVTTTDMIGMLVDAGVDVIGAAYPKAANEGFEGVASTVEALRARGLSVTGAYADESAAAQPAVMTLGGVHVAVLQYTDSLSSGGQKKLKSANAEYAVSIAGAERIESDIALARQAGAEVVIVCLNWGEDDSASPGKAQKTLAQAIADAGADAIIGCGTRSVQTAVWLQSGSRQVFCAYSLGALLNEGRSDKNVASYVLQLDFTVGGDGSVSVAAMECIPTYTWRYKENGKYRYFVVPSAEVAPDDMSDAQVESKERALKNVRKILQDSPLTVPELAE